MDVETSCITRGDIVQDASGGPRMVVCEVVSPVRVRCIWVQDGDRYFANTFHPRLLVKVDGEIGDVLGLSQLELN